MKHFLELRSISFSTMNEIFSIADTIDDNKNFLTSKSVVLFFPNSSIRTRVTFEKGIAALGGQPILFSSDALDKREEIRDVVGYLNNWADCLIVRHNCFEYIQDIAKYSAVPVINAMTSENHPCEILSDLYSISKRTDDYLSLQYTFIGKCGNIGNTWFDASRALGFRFRQCCPKARKYEIPGADIVYELDTALQGSDVILTDSLPIEAREDFKPYQITIYAMSKANSKAILNPCPPFYRGEEVSADVVDSPFFVGYQFKASLLTVQQALIVYLLRN